jgi:thymidylate kinase
MIIALEGLDGVGKSTVAADLAKHLGATVLSLPPDDLKLQKPSFTYEYRSPSRYFYYLAAAVRMSELAAMEARHVIFDRYIDSVHSMHAPLMPEIADDMRRLSLGIARPEFTFLLNADEAERRRRLARRGKAIDPFEEQLFEDRFRNEVLSAFESNVNAIRIETTQLSVPKVVNMCIDHVAPLLERSQRIAPP